MCSDIQLDNLTTRKLNVSITFANKLLSNKGQIMYKDRHTKEHFDEMLGVIHDYEAFCRTHEDYPNGKCVHAIANINRVYDELLEKNDFL